MEPDRAKVIIVPTPQVAGTNRSRLPKRPPRSHELAFPAVKPVTPSDDKGIAILPLKWVNKKDRGR